MAQKIYTSNYITSEVDNSELKDSIIDTKFDEYIKDSEKYISIMPNVVGKPVMDAISLLENMKLTVQCKGNGIITEQSIQAGTKVKPKNNVVLKAE